MIPGNNLNAVELGLELATPKVASDLGVITEIA